MITFEGWGIGEIRVRERGVVDDGGGWKIAARTEKTSVFRPMNICRWRKQAASSIARKIEGKSLVHRPEGVDTREKGKEGAVHNGCCLFSLPFSSFSFSFFSLFLSFFFFCKSTPALIRSQWCSFFPRHARFCRDNGDEVFPSIYHRFPTHTYSPSNTYLKPCAYASWLTRQINEIFVDGIIGIIELFAEEESPLFLFLYKICIYRNFILKKFLREKCYFYIQLPSERKSLPYLISRELIIQ